MKYHPLLRITHWLMGICILGLIALGWYMGTVTPENGKYALYGWHKSFGMLLIFLFPIRFILRKATTIPPLPTDIKPVEKKLSHLTHILLYIGMILVPVSGYLMSLSGGHEVKMFGLHMPNLIEKDKVIGDITHEIHEIAPYVLLGLVVLHIVGALKHKFFEKPENDVLNRMI
jgi:cytochrome b561